MSEDKDLLYPEDAPPIQRFLEGALAKWLSKQNDFNSSWHPRDIRTCPLIFSENVQSLMSATYCAPDAPGRYVTLGAQADVCHFAQAARVC